ncbi:hypothetical protein BH24ACI2_BH24ACI2_15400 [soil metagenome]|nr:GNAT family N-acetyltransferase [Acidobacteriota bacterium]
MRQLHNAALKQYVTQTWGWDNDWQQQNFERNFNSDVGEIIVINGTDAGFLWVIEKETETLLASIRMLPEFQNKGIGTKIIQKIIGESQKKNKPVRLQVLKINPAKKLYERLGFEIFDETKTHFLMKTPNKDFI